MSSKKFFIFSLIAASLLFVIFSGGCGGRGGTVLQPDNDDSGEKVQTGSDLEKFFISNDHIAILNEIISENNLNPPLRGQNISDKIILFTSESNFTDTNINLSDALKNGYTMNA